MCSRPYHNRGPQKSQQRVSFPACIPLKSSKDCPTLRGDTSLRDTGCILWDVAGQCGKCWNYCCREVLQLLHGTHAVQTHYAVTKSQARAARPKLERTDPLKTGEQKPQQENSNAAQTCAGLDTGQHKTQQCSERTLP